MRKVFHIILGIAVAGVGVFSCDTAGQIDDFNEGVTNASLAVWVDTPFSDSDSLSLVDPSSTVAFEVEFLDESNGSLVEAFSLDVSDGDNDGNLITLSTFSASENGNQGFSTEFSLNDVLAALGTSLSDYESEDEFSFSGSLTRGGEVFPFGNSLNAVQDFTLEIE